MPRCEMWEDGGGEGLQEAGLLFTRACCYRGISGRAGLRFISCRLVSYHAMLPRPHVPRRTSEVRSESSSGLDRTEMYPALASVGVCITSRSSI
jgi:hypothetical protein